MSEEMADVKEYVETTKEYTKALMGVNVTLAEIKGDLKNISDVKSDLNNVSDTATEANNRSKENEKDINNIQDNNRRITIALITVGGGFVLQLIFFLLTFGIK